MLETRSLQDLIHNWTYSASDILLLLLDEGAKLGNSLSLLQRRIGVPMPVLVSNNPSAIDMNGLTGMASRARIEAGCSSLTALASHLSNEGVLA